MGISMKSLLLYYSTTGNTRVACEYIKSKIKNTDLILYDILSDEELLFSDYDVIGVAFFTDSWQPPKLLMSYVEKLNNLAGKYAFSINTYGCISGKSARTMCKLLKNKKMKILGAHSLHTPENYPPMILSGHGFEESPNQKEKQKFDLFIEELDHQLMQIEQGEIPFEKKVKIGCLNAVLPSNPNFFMNIVTGKQGFAVNEERCVQCGICVNRCPVKAITLKEKIMIEPRLCQKCWSCYNHCPQQAIYKGKYQGEGQYKKPLVSYYKKMSSLK